VCGPPEAMAATVGGSMGLRARVWPRCRDVGPMRLSPGLEIHGVDTRRWVRCVHEYHEASQCGGPLHRKPRAPDLANSSLGRYGGTTKFLSWHGAGDAR
jgi:hypothetical protein